MAIPPQYDFRIATGLNNAAGLVNVEALVDSNGRYFYAPVLVDAVITRQPAVNGVLFTRGYQSFTWESDVWRAQAAYLKTTLLSGNESGYVTFRTLYTYNDTTYATWQGVLTLPDMNQFNRNYSQYQGFRWQFTRCTPVTP